MKANKMLSILAPIMGIMGEGINTVKDFVFTNPRKAFMPESYHNRRRHHPKTKRPFGHSHFGTFAPIKHVYGLKLSWELK